VARSVMLFPPVPGVVAVIVTWALLAAALTPTTDPHPLLFIRFARFVALVFVVELLVKFTVLMFELNV